MTDNILHDLTRRDFLSALIAIPALKFLPLSLTNNARMLTELPVIPNSGTAILEQVWFNPGAPLGRDGNNIFAECGIARLNKDVLEPILQFRLHWAAGYHWVATPGQGIICTEKYPVVLYSKGIPGVTHNRIIRSAIFKDGSGVTMLSTEGKNAKRTRILAS